MTREEVVRDVVERMLQAYGRQEEAYAEILRLAHRGVELVSGGRPLAEVHRVNLEKRRWLGVVDEIETALAPDKERWRASARPAAEAARLDTMLQRLRDLIEAILQAEGDCDRILHESLGRTEVPAC